jgi:hypothetical protein
VERVQRFLGVEPQTPADATFRFNASPPPHRLSKLRKPVARALRRVGWDRISVERRERISSGIERALARVVPANKRDMAPETLATLRRYYAPDYAPLTELIGAPPPWPTRA